MQIYTCTMCGAEWSTNYCPKCAHTIVAPTRTENFVDNDAGNSGMNVLSAESHGVPGSAAGNALIETITPVRIPVGWVWTLTVLFVVSAVLSAIAYVALPSVVSDDDSIDTIIGLLLIVVFGSFVATIMEAVLGIKLLYRAWTAIQDEHVWTTPGRAVGYLFVPVFNLYWFFVAWGGVARSFNIFTSRHDIPAHRLSEDLFMAQCVLVFLAIPIPYIPTIGPLIGMLYGTAVGIIGLEQLWSLTTAVNEVHDYLMGVQSKSPA